MDQMCVCQGPNKQNVNINDSRLHIYMDILAAGSRTAPHLLLLREKTRLCSAREDGGPVAQSSPQ